MPWPCPTAIPLGHCGSAYQMLVDMTVVLTFIPIGYLFLALPVLRLRAGGDRSATLRVPGGLAGLAAVTGSGLVSTLVAIGCALAPPAGGSATVFYAKVLGGCVLFLGVGGALYFSSARRGRQRTGPLALSPGHSAR